METPLENKIEISQSGEQITLSVSGCFGARFHTDFADIYQNKPKGCRYLLDFTHVSHVDSGGIGMLLLLREYLGNQPNAIQIRHCQPQVLEILLSSRMDTLISIA